MKSPCVLPVCPPLLAELIEALRAQLEEAGRYGKRAGAGAPGQDINRSGVPSSFFDGGMESSNEDSDDNDDRGLGIREVGRILYDGYRSGLTLGVRRVWRKCYGGTLCRFGFVLSQS